jgi:hypothetical protein
MHRGGIVLLVSLHHVLRKTRSLVHHVYIEKKREKKKMGLDVEQLQDALKQRKWFEWNGMSH